MAYTPNENVYRPEDFIGVDKPSNWPEHKAYPSDPTLRGDVNDRCFVCNKFRCSCHSNDLVRRPSFEIIQYGGKGWGIKTLQDIEPDDVLEEYVGQIFPITDEQDNDYSVLFEKGIAHISAKRFGNWTKYINHSCSPCALLAIMAIGERYRVMVVAKQHIAAGSELTIDYGLDYWLTGVPGEVEKFCLCGRPDCRYSDERRKSDTRRQSANELAF